MAKLTTKKRNRLPSRSFVFKGSRKYPIEDKAHARNALARSSGKPAHAAVKRAVKRKFPDIKVK